MGAVRGRPRRRPASDAQRRAQRAEGERSQRVVRRSASAPSSATASTPGPSTPSSGSPVFCIRRSAVLIVNFDGSRRALTALQLERHRDRRARARPHRERRGDQLAAAVLQVVDVDLVAARGDRPRDRRDLGQVRAHGARQHLGERRASSWSSARAERQQHVQAVLTGGLDEVRGAELVEQRVDVARDRRPRARTAPPSDRDPGSASRAGRARRAARSTRAAGSRPS